MMFPGITTDASLSTFIAANDNNNGQCTSGDLGGNLAFGSFIEGFALTAGVTYYIVVDATASSELGFIEIYLLHKQKPFTSGIQCTNECVDFKTYMWVCADAYFTPGRLALVFTPSFLCLKA